MNTLLTDWQGVQALRGRMIVVYSVSEVPLVLEINIFCV